MRTLVSENGVRVQRGDQCPFGPQVRGADGATALVMRPTGWCSNCEEILDELGVDCPNRASAEVVHRHTDVEGGRCSHAERYPVELIRAILRGFRHALRQGVPFGWHIDAVECGPTLDEPGLEESVDFETGHADRSLWAESAQAEFFDVVSGFCLPKFHLGF